MQNTTPTSPPAQKLVSQKVSPSFERLVPEPRTRCFICGFSGSGKSTVAGTLLDGYHRKYPTHPLFIVDPKLRFFPERDRDFAGLLPNGPGSAIHGKREGVVVNGRLLGNVASLRVANSKDTVWVAQDPGVIEELFVSAFKRADVRRPQLFYLDESIDFIQWVRASPSLRRIIQMGREAGIGIVIINQRPKFIDKTFLTEATRLYVGMLTEPDDRKAVASACPSNVRPHLLEELPQYDFWMVDRLKPANSLYFRLKLAS